MSAYVSQGISTMRYGITFRSKLEAVWAEFFQSQGTPWTYIDTAWADFEIVTAEDGLITHVEVKPIGNRFLWDAVLRAWKHRDKWPKVGDQHRMMILCGEPSVMESWVLETTPGIDGLGYAREVIGAMREFWIFNGMMMKTETLKTYIQKVTEEDIRKEANGAA